MIQVGVNFGEGTKRGTILEKKVSNSMASKESQHRRTVKARIAENQGPSDCNEGEKLFKTQERGYTIWGNQER